jgi:hypothetical protein
LFTYGSDGSYEACYVDFIATGTSKCVQMCRDYEAFVSNFYQSNNYNGFAGETGIMKDHPATAGFFDCEGPDTGVLGGEFDPVDYDIAHLFARTSEYDDALLNQHVCRSMSQYITGLCEFKTIVEYLELLKTIGTMSTKTLNTGTTRMWKRFKTLEAVMDKLLGRVYEPPYMTPEQKSHFEQWRSTELEYS